MAARIHPTAVISPEADIGDGVEIGPYCRIEGASRIGAGTILQSNVFVDRNTTLGERNFLGHGVVMGTPPQDKKFNEDVQSYLIVGDDNTFREYFTANRATGEGARTVIGSRCMLMTGSHVAHNCVLGDEVVMANVATLAGHVEIHDWCVIGGVIALHQHTRIGKGAFLGGFSGLRQDLPPFFRAAGNPGRPVGVNLVGMQRRGIPREAIRAVQAVFKLLYRMNLKLDQALDRAAREYGEIPEVQTIIEFVQASKSGIVRPRSGGDADQE